jgi:hypothetical protein
MRTESCRRAHCQPPSASSDSPLRRVLRALPVSEGAAGGRRRLREFRAGFCRRTRECTAGRGTGARARREARQSPASGQRRADRASGRDAQAAARSVGDGSVGTDRRTIRRARSATLRCRIGYRTRGRRGRRRACVCLAPSRVDLPLGWTLSHAAQCDVDAPLPRALDEPTPAPAIAKLDAMLTGGAQAPAAAERGPPPGPRTPSPCR